ncbi:MAG: CARDB domain-containing protein, partial [Nanoarchaeota archaeon]
MKIDKMLMLSAVVVFAALLNLPGAFASLQVTAFSCNGETGTVNVPNNIAFTCSATINNPDDSTASLSSAKLYIDGSWATQSYDASGFSTSLATGASSTATFTDVTSTTPGSHKFSYILLDGVSDTFVADTVVNVMDIKIARVRTNTTSAGQNAPFN